MKNGLLKVANKLNKNHKQKKWWQRTVRVMGTMVVFCTTYALILPAITMEQKTLCGLEAHEHVESCYIQQPVSVFTCGPEEGVTVVHSHDTICYDGQGTLICTLPEVVEHTHDDGCYSLAEHATCGYAHVHSDACVTVRRVQICGQEETPGHTHSDACTTQVNLICQIPEEAGHTHGEGCGSVVANLICTETEDEAHSHGEECYETTLIPCEIPESAGHTHGEGCYETVEISCEIPESAGHAHNEACYESQEVPCEQTTVDGHVHTETCYPKQLTCDQPEVKLHAHDPITCYSANGTFTCTTPERKAHIHGESCLVQTEQMQDVLICELEVHEHEESCYPEEEDAPYEYICGFGIHTHVETCYDEAGELTCTIPEHAHDASCIVEDLDLTADVETAEQWEETFADVVLTGHWPEDVLAVAETQLDYKESEKNLVLAEDVLKGYTRYGQWYGDPYGDWNAMFASFCLNYAGVEDFPLESDAELWIAALEEDQLYKTPDVYAPKPGDLIFIDFDQEEDAEEEIPVTADLVGIVAEMIPATEEEPAQYKFIAGDYDDQVSYVTCDVDDVTIVGYAQMPAGEISYMHYEGADFTVTVTLSKDAAIPATAKLMVREILKDTEEYNTYYQQSMDALMRDLAPDAEMPEVSFARFFDISFAVDGVIIEPAAPVDVQIRYSDVIEKKEEESGLVVHFAQEGVEVLNADTYCAEPVEQEDTGFLSDLVEFFTGKSEQVDTFQFTQDSFSISGTLFAVTPRAGAKEATRVNFDDLDGTGNTEYIIYTQRGNQYYAIAAPATGKTGKMVEVEIKDGTVTWTSDDSVRWNFVSTGNGTYDITNENGRFLHAFYNGNGSDIGVIGTGSKGALLISQGTGANETFKVKHPTSSAYVGISGSQFQATTSDNNAANFYIAAVEPSVYHVWFDGTNGGMMSYYGAEDRYQAVDPANNTIALPKSPDFGSSTKYDYVLKGWYDINHHKYYSLDEVDKVKISGNTVFYADWVAATYDVGENNDHVVDSLDTNDFITTYVFDYNALFNVMSQTHTGTISATDHSETWTFQPRGTNIPNNSDPSLGFVFVDYDANGEFSYANGRDNMNINQGDAITEDILEKVEDASGKDLLKLLFTPKNASPEDDDFVIGKNYVGTGNYLYQYMDSTTPNYDGVHDGYYYLDARLNAASYNQTLGRFYLYDYLERTSDSDKDGGVGQYSDFLPFNSPYIFEADQLDEYTDSIRRPGYEYDAKDGGTNYPEYNSLYDATTNYFFGIRSDIEFFLPNDAGSMDAYDNYGNISTRGEHMVFDFHGDDDVWVFIDNELVLDIGGLHGVMFGQIDFSTGNVITGKDGGTTTTKTFKDLLGHNITEGTHTMTVYYMERGSSQSNCAIYFNIAPRFDLQITKEDVYSAQTLANAEFTVYTCEGCANVCDQCQDGSCSNEKHKENPVTSCPQHGTELQYAELWATQDDYDADMDEDGLANHPIHTMITSGAGVAKCWGLSAGKTYYIKETEPPTVYNPAYPRHDDVIRVTLNNRGTASIETTTLHGTDTQITEGYAVIEQSVDNTLKLVSLTITNQQDHETTKVRVKKEWANGATDLPNSIIAYLMKDGVKVGREAVLNDANGWTYTWEGLPKYELDATNTPVEIKYTVGEIQVPGYTTSIPDPKDYQDHVDWIKTEHMEDSATYLLVNGNGALAYNGRNFYWMDAEEAKGSNPNYKDANWYVTTLDYGFRLKNESGYYLAFSRSGSYFTGTTSPTGLNQVIYYLENRLVVHDNDLYYQLYSVNGQSAAADGLTFDLIRKDVINGTGFIIENTPITYDGQTFVEVNKVWDDTLDHSQDSVTVHLYADGEKTTTSLVLNEKNNWYGIIEGLPLKNGSGAEIEYTFLEDEPSGYDAEYEVSSVFRPLVTWVKVNSLTTDNIYRIVDGAEALGVTSTGALQVAQNNANDERQWWTPVSQGSRTILKSYGMNIYLKVEGSTMTTVSSAANASTVNLNGDRLSFRVGTTNYYLQMTNTAVTVTTQSNNATAFNVMVRSTQNLPGTSVKVTNVEEVAYELPKTGSIGPISHYTFGSVLCLAAALMYINKFGRKQQRGGKYSR